jgi:hypothetical protein
MLTRSVHFLLPFMRVSLKSVSSTLHGSKQYSLNHLAISLAYRAPLLLVPYSAFFSSSSLFLGKSWDVNVHWYVHVCN